MIDGTYRITLRTPKGVNDGFIVLATSGSILTANLTVDGIGSLRQNGTHDGDEFELNGSHNLFLHGRLSYKIRGLVAGDLLKATCTTDKGTFDIAGSRIA